MKRSHGAIPQGASRRSPAAIWCLLPLAALAAYWPCLSGGLVYDDWVNFDRNQALRDRDWLALLTRPYFGHDTTYWRPITSVAMGLAYLAGPLGVHLLALVAHVLAACAVGAIGRRILGDPLLALCAALVFLLHPLQVESVAWGSALPGVLSGLFLLLAVRVVLSWSARNDTGPPWAAGCWLLGALLAKESAVVGVPLLAVVASVGTRSRAAKLAVSGAAAAVGAAWFAWHVAMVDWRPVLGDGGAWVAGCGQMTVRQVGLLVLPWPLTPFRSHPNAAGSVGLDTAAIAVAGVLVAVAAVVVASPRVASRWRVATALLAAPLLLASVLYAGVGPHPLTDRYLYVSVGGFALLVVAAVGRRFFGLGALAVAYGAVTFGQSHVWRDDGTFVAHVATVSPQEPCVHVLVGTQALRNGGAASLHRARSAYRTAIEIRPPWLDDFARRQRAAAIAGLAWCDFEEAGADAGPALLERFRAAIAEYGKYVPAWVGVGVALGWSGEFEAATKALQTALALDPWCPEAWFNLAQTQLDMGQPAEARESLQQALRCNPDLAPAKVLLAQLREVR
jgi:hypothetical protein